MYLESSHGEIFYEIHGDENSSMTLVFVHGALSDHTMFDRQVREFSDQYRVIVWDMPEHGRSVRLEREFRFSIAAECLVELLDALNAQEVVLAGVSMGGYVSQFAASRYPERVRGVAVEGCSPLHMQMPAQLRLGFLVFSLAFKMMPLPVIQYVFRRLSFSEESSEYVESVLSELDKKRFTHIYGGLRNEVLRGIDEPISQPVLITHGEHEMPVMRRMCAEWHESTLDSEYVVIPGGGHDGLFVNPGVYEEALRSFLQRLGE